MIRNETRLILAGTLLIGVSYGLGRFAYGLFLPSMREDVGLSSAMAGVIGSGAYVGYCVAILLSALLVERLGARLVSVVAALIAAAGMVVISVSTSPLLLAGAILLAGTSTGLASPPMAQAVSQAIPEARQSRANTLINAGTSLGVAVSGPVAFLATGQWRIAYAAFAVTALCNALMLLVSVPRSGVRADVSKSNVEKNSVAKDSVAKDDVSKSDVLKDDAAKEDNGAARGGLWRPRVFKVVLAAVGTGTASAAYWTFSSEAVVTLGQFDQTTANVVWILIGVAGLVGGLAGDLVERLGLNVIHRGSLAALALSSCLLAIMPTSLPAVLVSAALFGTAYIMLSGIYLVWGIRLYPDRPAIGLGLPFLMIAVGQIIGSPLAGYLIGSRGYAFCFIVFALIAVATMLIGYRRDGPDASKPAQKVAVLPAQQRTLGRFYMPAMPPLAFIEKRRHRSKG